MPFFIKTEKFNKETMCLASEARKEYLSEHKDWIAKLKKSGKNIYSGYLVNTERKPGGGGVLIVESESFEEAKSLIVEDPMIKNNLVNWDIHELISVDGAILKINY